MLGIVKNPSNNNIGNKPTFFINEFANAPVFEIKFPHSKRTRVKNETRRNEAHRRI